MAFEQTPKPTNPANAEGYTQRCAPLKKWFDRGIEIAAWPTKFGSRYTFSKRYKDKATNTWKDSNSYFASDLRCLMGLLKDALDYANEQEGRAREQLAPTNFRDSGTDRGTASGIVDKRQIPIDEEIF